MSLFFLLSILCSSQHMLGGLTTTLTSSVVYTESSKPIEVVDDSQNFGGVANPIFEKALPLVDLYRSGHETRRPVIAITGCSGVGKSHFSRLLLSSFLKMGVHAKILKFDDFLDPEPFEGAKEEIHPRFDWLRVHSFLERVLEGEEVLAKPAWDQSGPKPFKIVEEFDLRDVELLIVEGIFALCDEQTYDLVKFSDIRIVLDAEDEDIIDWDWKRDRFLETDNRQDFVQLKIESIAKYRELLSSAEKYVDFRIKKTSAHQYDLAQ